MDLLSNLIKNEILASAELVWEQIEKQNIIRESFSTVHKAKNSLRACTFNILDLYDKQIYKDEKKVKVIQNLRRELVILKPDKGNGIVPISIADYYKSLDHLFSDTSKFRQLKEDPTQMRFLSLQNFLLKR